jgi:glutathione S-transferase
VPSYRDEEVQLFESGAIALHIGRKFGTLLPRDEAGRARATAWVIAALNSVEPFLAQLPTIDIFHAGEAWTKERRPQVIEMIERRLDRLSEWLGNKDWLEDEFTAGDLLMADVLRIVEREDGLLEQRPNLLDYMERAKARPAFSGPWRRSLPISRSGSTPPKQIGDETDDLCGRVRAAGAGAEQGRVLPSRGAGGRVPAGVRRAPAGGGVGRRPAGRQGHDFRKSVEAQDGENVVFAWFEYPTARPATPPMPG